VGLGIIIYVAANWDVIPAWARVSMLVGLTAATNVAGWLLLTRFDYPRVGVAMLVVGALAYGAAIHLIAQIYHVPVNHPNLTTAWFLGVLPLAYIARSRVMVALALTLLVLSMGFRTQWWFEFYGADTRLYLAPLTLTLSAAVVALGLLQLRFTWTRPLAVYCFYPGLAFGLAAFGAMTVASISVDLGNLTWAALSVSIAMLVVDWSVLPFFTVILVSSTALSASLKVSTTFEKSPEDSALENVGRTPSTLWEALSL